MGIYHHCADSPWRIVTWTDQNGTPMCLMHRLDLPDMKPWVGPQASVSVVGSVHELNERVTTVSYKDPKSGVEFLYIEGANAGIIYFGPAEGPPLIKPDIIDKLT